MNKKNMLLERGKIETDLNMDLNLKDYESIRNSGALERPSLDDIISDADIVTPRTPISKLENINLEPIIKEVQITSNNSDENLIESSDKKLEEN
jgi:hypothetical protein